MEFCCEGLETAFRGGFCNIRTVRSKDQKDKIDFAISMGLIGVRMDFCPFCGQKVSVTLHTEELV